ncbi:unnamed protein product [Absidia cylindrospora]
MTSHSDQLIWDDLLSWQKEIKEKDLLLNKRKPLRDQVLEPIRKPIHCTFDKKKQLGLNHLNGKNTPTAARNTTKTAGQSKIQQKALAEKEKGNAHFQKQEYQQAIRFYSEAINLDPTNAVYFVNRAMAYLKVKNYLQAEQDCTKCLNLQPNHVKALWRRGMALRSLGRSNEARKDFERALEIEPGNKLILEELDKMPPLSKGITKEQPPKDHSVRQLEINVIDEAYTPIESSKKKDSPTSAVFHEKPKVETISASSKITPATSSAPTSTPSATTESSIQQNPSSTTVITSVPSTVSTGSITLSPLKLTCPRTNYEFERDWKACKRRGDDVIYQYLQCIPPSSYATIFKSSLEPDQFEKIIDIVDRYYMKDKPSDEVLQILQGLGQVKRLDMLVMFLEKKYKQALDRIFVKLVGQIPKPTLLPLASKFSVILPQ